MQKQYPTLEIPKGIKCLRGPNQRGTFDGRADSEVYLDEKIWKLYKKYPYQPGELAIYHIIQTNLASHPALTYDTIKDTVFINEAPINKVIVQFLPLRDNQIYTTKCGGTIRYTQLNTEEQ